MLIRLAYRYRPDALNIVAELFPPLSLCPLIRDEGSAGATAIQDIHQYHVRHGERGEADEYDPYKSDVRSRVRHPDPNHKSPEDPTEDRDGGDLQINRPQRQG